MSAEGIKVLPLRDLESYLWSDEVLTKLATEEGQAAQAQLLIAEKARLLSALPTGTPADDIKAISGQLYGFCTRLLRMTQRGNNAEAFAISTLAPLVTSDTQTYQELETAIFGRGTP